MSKLNEIEILLVEDNPDDARLTLRALEKKHLANKVYHVKDGEEALKFLFEPDSLQNPPEPFKPKVVFLDLKLPKVSGLEVLKEIRAHSQTRTLPVVVLTSSREDQDIIDSYHLGVNSYIVKPVDFEKFMSAIIDLGMYWVVLNEAPGQ